MWVTSGPQSPLPHAARKGILWATIESSTTSRPQGHAAKNTNAHKNIQGHSVKGTISGSSTWRKKKLCFACRRCQHQHNNARHKKTQIEDFGFAHPTEEETRHGVSQNAPAKERHTEPSMFWNPVLVRFTKSQRRFRIWSTNDRTERPSRFSNKPVVVLFFEGPGSMPSDTLQ